MFTYKIDDELSMKQIELKDAKELFVLTDSSRTYLKEWLPWLDMTLKIEDTEEFIKSCMKSYSEKKGLNAVILYQGKIVGTAGYNQINWTNRTAHIGYWLSEENQGKGIMTKAARALTQYAFKELSLNKVEIRAAAQNWKSRSIPERLGFICEGTLREAEWLYDHFVDHAVYGMLAAEWNE